MKRCIIAGLLTAVLLMLVFSPVVLAEDLGSPGSPFGPYQEPPSVAMGDNAEQGLDDPYGHVSNHGEWLDFAGRPYYIGRVEEFYP